MTHVVDNPDADVAHATSNAMYEARASLLSEQLVGRVVSEITEWGSECIEKHVGVELTPFRRQRAEYVTDEIRQASRGWRHASADRLRLVPRYR